MAWSVDGKKDLRRAYIQARYHENVPKTKAEIANSMALRQVDAARVPNASLDILEVSESRCRRKMRGIRKRW